MKWGEVGKYGESVRWVGNEGEEFLKEGEILGKLHKGPPVQLCGIGPKRPVGI